VLALRQVAPRAAKAAAIAQAAAWQAVQWAAEAHKQIAAAEQVLAEQEYEVAKAKREKARAKEAAERARRQEVQRLKDEKAAEARRVAAEAEAARAELARAAAEAVALVAFNAAQHAWAVVAALHASNVVHEARLCAWWVEDNVRRQGKKGEGLLTLAQFRASTRAAEMEEHAKAEAREAQAQLEQEWWAAEQARDGGTRCAFEDFLKLPEFTRCQQRQREAEEAHLDSLVETGPASAARRAGPGGEGKGKAGDKGKGAGSGEKGNTNKKKAGAEKRAGSRGKTQK
jgi:colicin import membrane protein